MSVKITTSNWVNQMPTFDYKIIINGVQISLLKEDFSELVKELDNKISEDLAKAIEVKEKYNRNVDKIKELRKDLLSVFYINDGDGDEWYIAKPKNDIDSEKLYEALDKHGRFLGLE